MKFKEIVSKTIIDPSKLINYCLNKDHEKGHNKAIMFERYLGFNQENYQILLEKIQAQVMEGEAIIGYYDDYGQRYRVDISIVGVKAGQKETVQTGWLVAPEAKIARLVTVFIRSR